MVNDTQNDVIMDINNKCYKQVRGGTTTVTTQACSRIQTAPITRQCSKESFIYPQTRMTFEEKTTEHCVYFYLELLFVQYFSN